MFKILKKHEELLAIVIIISILVFMLGITTYILWYHKSIMIFIQIITFLMLVIHYMCTMGNQSIFYGYFQSWEWKEAWEDNDLSRIAGKHYDIIKKGLINSIGVLGIAGIILYLLWTYKLINWYGFSDVIWFDTDKLYGYIMNAYVLNVYWYILLGFGVLFWSMIIYFLVYPKYPEYLLDTAPLDNNILEYRKVTIRDTLILGIFLTIIVGYILFNIPALIASYDPDIPNRGKVFPLIGVAIFAIFFHAHRARLYWIHGLGVLYIIGLGSYIWLLYTAFYHDSKNLYNTIEILTNIMKIIIPSALAGTILITVVCLLTVLISILRTKRNQESEYNELCKKMKPWLGFNNRFIMESFIEGKTYDFKELYELTHVKKKWLFWLEYFFANILNRNVVSLLQNKKLLWLKVLFNSVEASNMRGMQKIKWVQNEDDFPIFKKPKYHIPTRNKAKFEDPEGDVFTNLLIEEVPNTQPSIILPFYTTGLIYLNVIPYFIIYNIVMYIIFTKFVDVMIPMNIEVINELLYGYTGVMILIFVGFLLSIFANNMAVWLAWKKYYRLQQQGNQEAIFFSIFKQRVIYQHIYDYKKDDKGNVITVNYEDGLYPQFNLEKLDDIAKELSPRYYDLYSRKYLLYKNR